MDRIVRYVGHDKHRFNALMKVFLEGDPLVQQRAGWPLSYCVEANPSFILPHLGKLLKLLERTDVHNAVTRNITRMLQNVTIPPKYQGPDMAAPAVQDRLRITSLLTCFSVSNTPSPRIATAS